MPATRWTPEQARHFARLGAASRERKRKDRLAESLAKQAMLGNPSAALPGQLHSLIGSITAEIERCKASSHPDKAERWCKVLERLVRLERLVSSPPARSKNGAGASSVAAVAIKPTLARPEPNPAGDPTTDPGQVQSAGPPPATLATSSSPDPTRPDPTQDDDPDPSPLESAPID